jgi:hypothetical protein
MANIRKSFNFRNGVQVDTDNFVVNANGLVGIGTTIPGELLDVRGDARISGILSISQIISSDIKSVTANVDGNLNIGIVSIASGIITSSNPTGVVTYFGDGGNLINLPTSQWIDVDPGFGYTSIYAAGNVGVGTTFPNFSFQVGGNPNFSSGLGINSEGEIYTTGIITAGFFNGDGFLVSNINADNISSGTLDSDRLPIIPNENLPNNISISGIITAQSGFVGNISGNINSTGISTFSGGIIGSVTGNVTGNINSTGVSTFSGGIVGNVTGNINSTGVSTFSGGIVGNVTGNLTGNVIGIASTARDLTSDARVTIDHINAQTSEIGISTISTRLYAESIGVGTNSPSSDIHIRKSSQSRLQVTSDTAAALVSVGRSTSLTENSGALRFGNISELYPYSTPRSLDVMNFDSGNINLYLEANGFAGIGTGSFHWHRRSSEVLMTLTYEGNLGIGKTDPTVSLDVVGTTTCINAFVNADLYVGNNSTIGNNLTVEGDILANGGFTLSSGSINANLNGNVNASSGVSTFSTLILNDNLLVNDNIAIGGFTPQDIASNPDIKLAINPNSIVSFLVNNLGQVAIGVTEFLAEGINAPDRSCVFGGVGVGTDRGYLNVCPVDFTFAGRRALDIDGNNPFVNKEYMRVPLVTTTERNNFTGLIGGEIIYNKTTNKHQGYNGSTWNDLY